MATNDLKKTFLIESFIQEMSKMKQVFLIEELNHSNPSFFLYIIQINSTFLIDFSN